MKQIFEDIYTRQAWGKGKGSGTGSSPVYCALYLDYLRDLMRANHYERVLDLGCGDWQLYRGFSWGNIRYTGVDVVERLVDLNEIVHGYGHRQFVCADFSDPRVLEWLVHEHSPQLIIVKDVLQHWPDEAVKAWLAAMLAYPWRTCIAVNNWQHHRSPHKNKLPRNVKNSYRWAPIDMRQWGFKDVLYYPRGKFKQVARLDHPLEGLL